MAFSEAQIKQLIKLDGYNPSKIPKLEEYLLQTCRGDAPYVFDGVRVLIKLYTLFPAKANDTNMAYACLVTFLNDRDSLLALQYMIPMSTQKQEPSRTILSCSELLSACRYPEFWTAFESLQKSSDSVIQKMTQSSVSSLQSVILSTLALSYRKAPLPLVLRSLNSTALPTTKECTIEGKDTVVFAATANNTKRERAYQEGVNFSTVSGLLQKMAQ